MRTLFSVAATIGLLVATMTPGSSAGASNLNSSKSNLYRLVYSSDAVSAAQAAAILADLDRAGRADESRAGQLIQQLLPKHGVRAGSITKIIVRPWDPKRKSMSVIILSNAADEAQAIAVSDEGAPGDKPSTSAR